jgi:hypothetical protein
MEPIFRCPACNGRIALWAVRAEFTCHHCRMLLKSNRAEALGKALLVALSVETLLPSSLFITLGISLTTLVTWGMMGGLLGYWGGWLAVKHFMIFQPVRRNSTIKALND